MTKDEAIYLLRNTAWLAPSGTLEPVEEAVDMAIEALQRTSNAHPTHDSVKPTHECDTINRGEALNLVLDVCNDVMDECETVTGVCGEEVYTDVREVDAILKCNKRIRNGIRRLPSAQPERKKGRWLDYTDEGYVECPFCHSATNCDGNKDELHFCFSCGADMKGADDDI